MRRRALLGSRRASRCVPSCDAARPRQLDTASPRDADRGPAACARPRTSVVARKRVARTRSTASGECGMLGQQLVERRGIDGDRTSSVRVAIALADRGRPSIADELAEQRSAGRRTRARRGNRSCAASTRTIPSITASAGPGGSPSTKIHAPGRYSRRSPAASTRPRLGGSSSVSDCTSPRCRAVRLLRPPHATLESLCSPSMGVPGPA